MKRDYFTLEIANIDWVDGDASPEQPSLTIRYDGPTDALHSALHTDDGTALTGDELDVGYRLQTPLDDPSPTGVVSVTHRFTGEYLLELNAEAEDILEFIRAARRYLEANTDNPTGYAVAFSVENEPIQVYEKDTFLVYNREGSLLSNHSLTPSGVEL